MIGETAKLYQKCEKPLKNRCFNEFYTNYRVEQNSDDEKKAEATRLLAMGMSNNTSDPKSQMLYEHYSKKSPQKFEIETKQVYGVPLESCRLTGRENDQKSSNRRVKNLCKVFQEKMEMLEKTVPETRKNTVINQIHGTVMKIQNKVDKEDKTPVMCDRETNSQKYNQKGHNHYVKGGYNNHNNHNHNNHNNVKGGYNGNNYGRGGYNGKGGYNINNNNNNRTTNSTANPTATPKKYNIKKTSIVNTGVLNFSNSVSPKSVCNLVKSFNKPNNRNEFKTPQPRRINNRAKQDLQKCTKDDICVQNSTNTVSNVTNDILQNDTSQMTPDFKQKTPEKIPCSHNIIDNDISAIIDSVVDEQVNYLANSPGYNNRYDMSPMSDGDIFEDLLRDLDEMIINQANEEAAYNLSDDEDQFENNATIDDQFAWFFKTVSKHVLSKPNNENVDQDTKEQLDWFLS